MSTHYKGWLTRVLAIANEAAAMMLDMYPWKAYQIKTKSDNTLVTEADLQAHQIIERGLLTIDPTVPIISEEGEAVPFELRSRWTRFWLVDPLDGTQGFIQGTGEFTINIALIENHLPVLGVVVAPALQSCYWALRGETAYAQVRGAEISSIQTRSTRPPIKVVVSRRHEKTSPFWRAFIKRLGDYELSYCGSALKICLIAKGEADVYPQLGVTHEWDTAAGQCILEAAGGQLIDLAGYPIRYNMRTTLENPKFFAVSTHHLSSLCCG